MIVSQLGLGAGFFRRLRATCAVALALVAWGVSLPTTDAAAAEWPAPLAYHATVLNGTITGSSFQIAEGLGVTNAHVIGTTAPGQEILLVVHQGGTPLRARARVLALSQRMDLALLSVPRGLLPVVPERDAPPSLGRAVRAAGVIARPDGPGRRMELSGHVTSDVLTLRPFGPGFIAHMPGVRRGFSGGPVIDGEGRFVGMIAALRPDPGRTTNATGEPLAGIEAFVLTAPAIRSEAARLLEEVSGR
jgi:S1-C subfamily serine protease